MAYTPKTWATDDPITVADLNRIEDGIDDVTTDLDDFMTDDTDWVTSGITAASGWTLTPQAYRKIRDTVYVTFRVERTGGTISALTGGNVADTAIATIPEGYRPTTTIGLSSGYGSQRVGAFSVDTDGVVRLIALSCEVDLTNGEYLGICGSYPV